MKYIVFFLLLTQTLLAAEPVDLRMGFHHKQNSLSVEFPKEFTLKLKDLDEGKQAYYAYNDGQEVVYEFACYGHALEGFTTFQNETLEEIKSAFEKRFPASKVTLNIDESRAILEHAADSGKRLVFVGDFFSIDGKLYLVSETLEVAASDTRDPKYLIDEAFLESFRLEPR